MNQQEHNRIIDDFRTVIKHLEADKTKLAIAMYLCLDLIREKYVETGAENLEIRNVLQDALKEVYSSGDES